MDVRASVLSAIREHGMLTGRDSVICALSGGADSVCLADVLLSLASEFPFRFSCAHFNHRLRGEEAQRDEDFVRAWCSERGIPLRVGSGDTAAWAREHGMGLEEAARQLRYAFLESLGGEGACIATAHQADDQAETLLMNLLRGAGPRGLCGIPSVRGRIIRPLLGVTREDILRYLSERNLKYVEDSTNAVPDVRRNRLRHQVLPLLREMNPRFSEACARSVRLLREDDEYLSRLASEELPSGKEERRLSAARLRELPSPVASRTLRQAAGAFGVQLEEKHVDALFRLLESPVPSARLSLPGNLTALRKYDELIVRPARPCPPPITETELFFGRWQTLPGGKWTVFWGSVEETTKIHGKFITFFFKKERICGKMLVRPRREGDRLQPPGRPGKSLKKWMIEYRIPAEERRRMPVFADEAGILAVPGIGPDVRAAAEREEADAVLLIAERT